MKPNITTFVFDCFGVICDPVLNGWYKDHRLNKGIVDDNIYNVFRKFDLGIFSEDNILEYFLKYDGITLTKKQLREDIDDYLKLDEKLALIIQQLRKSGYKIALLSNANHSFFERKIYTKYPHFKSYFDEIIISSIVGFAKPGKEIYLYALEKTKSKPDETLFIDDNKVNVEAAEKLGMHGYVYTDSELFFEHIKSLGLIS